MENLEELVDLSIQEIVHSLDQLGLESPAASIFSQPPPRIMVVFNQPAWRIITKLNLDAPLHGLPKHPEKV